MMRRRPVSGLGVSRRINRQPGTVTVEMALLAPLLISLLFGIIEGGLLIKDVVGLNHAAREGARCAAVGAMPYNVTASIEARTGGIDMSQVQKLYEYQAYDETTGTWGEWTVLGTGTAAGTNNAEEGDQIRVSLSYLHALATGSLVRGLAAHAQDGKIPLRAAVVMRRE